MDPANVRKQIRVTQKKRQLDTFHTKTEGLEGMFDGDEIDDQLATKQDKIIAETDIPERLQIKIGE